MTEYYRFFDSYGADTRQYTSGDTSEVLKRVRPNGVIPGVLNELAVTAGAGVSVNVGTGEYWINGRWYRNDASKNIALATPDATYSRIDRIIVKLDLSSAIRTIIATNKTGIPAASPVPPTLQQDGTIWEESLAQVLVPAGSGTPLTITNERTMSRQGELWQHAQSSTTPNGSTTQFNIGSGVASSKVRVYVNGLLRRPTTDYTFTSGNSYVTFVWAPATGDDVRMDYVAV